MSLFRCKSQRWLASKNEPCKAEIKVEDFTLGWASVSFLWTWAKNRIKILFTLNQCSVLFIKNWHEKKVDFWYNPKHCYPLILNQCYSNISAQSPASIGISPQALGRLTAVRRDPKHPSPPRVNARTSRGRDLNYYHYHNALSWSI